MLGHKLLQRLTEKYPDTYATVRQDLTEAPFCRVPFLQSDKIQRNMNVLATDSLRRTILDLKPDYILNCIGIVTQHKQHADPVSCIRVNSLLPHEIASIAAEYGGRVIHFSTDCVFDGKMGGYCEDDPPNATDVYGRSKALGELFCENTLTLRTSIIGRELRNYGSLLDWFLRHSGGRIKGYTRAIYSGVTTNEMANVVKLILERFPTLTGLFQVVADPISKYDLLREANYSDGALYAPSRSSPTMDLSSIEA